MEWLRFRALSCRSQAGSFDSCVRARAQSPAQLHRVSNVAKKMMSSRHSGDCARRSAANGGAGPKYSHGRRESSPNPAPCICLSRVGWAELSEAQLFVSAVAAALGFAAQPTRSIGCLAPTKENAWSMHQKVAPAKEKPSRIEAAPSSLIEIRAREH